MTEVTSSKSIFSQAQQSDDDTKSHTFVKGNYLSYSSKITSRPYGSLY